MKLCSNVDKGVLKAAYTVHRIYGLSGNNQKERKRDLRTLIKYVGSKGFSGENVFLTGPVEWLEERLNKLFGHKVPLPRSKERDYVH